MTGVDLKQHDPLDRQLEGEPRFALMGRDVLAPGMVRLYAAIVEGRYDRCHDILGAVVRAAKERAPRPHKDTSHAWSARRVADEMDMFYRLHMTGEQPENRINTAPDREPEFQAAPTVAEIKRAAPPREPDEAS